jgi:hypothetical protein
MINNLLGKYSEFIKFQQDGTVKVFIPEDLNNPSKEGATEVVLTQKEAIAIRNWRQSSARVRSRV